LERGQKRQNGKSWGGLERIILPAIPGKEGARVNWGSPAPSIRENTAGVAGEKKKGGDKGPGKNKKKGWNNQKGWVRGTITWKQEESADKRKEQGVRWGKVFLLLNVRSTTLKTRRHRDVDFWDRAKRIKKKKVAPKTVWGPCKNPPSPSREGRASISRLRKTIGSGHRRGQMQKRGKKKKREVHWLGPGWGVGKTREKPWSGRRKLKRKKSLITTTLEGTGPKYKGARNDQGDTTLWEGREVQGLSKSERTTSAEGRVGVISVNRGKETIRSAQNSTTKKKGEGQENGHVRSNLQVSKKEHM